MILAVVAAILHFCACKWKRVATNVLVISSIALDAMSVVNLITIKTSVDGVSAQYIAEDRNPHFQLSKTGQNVVVIMLDCAMGEYIPYLFNEKPELEGQFAGFTYYDNTISFGGYTKLGAPALYGGYEYTPIEMNKRTEEPLVAKHNEALKVMPVIFSENGYDVIVFDPAYANYQWIPDLSIYDNYPDVKAYVTRNQFDDPGKKKTVIDQNYRNFFCFSIMKSMPLFLQPTIYSGGRYYQAGSDFTQTMDDISLSAGMNADFMDPYYVLMNLPIMTKVTEDGTNTFFLMANDTTHDPMLLQEPDYIPAQNVDNTAYDVEHADRFVIDGKELKVENAMQMIHYHANMAAMLQLGNWFDYLRENGVYDNTRIILVSDHGRALAHLEEFILDDGSDIMKDVELYYPLLMVKDFDSEEFSASDVFMTNADVPTLAMEDIILNPINPFTGKTINCDEKTAHEQFIIRPEEWQVDENNGNTFLPAGWASVKDNIWNKNNWTFYDEPMVLDEHAVP